MKLYTKISIGLISGAVVGIGVNLTDWAVLTESSRTRHASYRGLPGYPHPTGWTPPVPRAILGIGESKFLLCL